MLPRFFNAETRRFFGDGMVRVFGTTENTEVLGKARFFMRKIWSAAASGIPRDAAFGAGVRRQGGAQNRCRGPLRPNTSSLHFVVYTSSKTLRRWRNRLSVFD